MDKVILDENLSWKSHIKLLENKIVINVGMLYKAKFILNQKSLKSIYYAFIHSYIKDIDRSFLYIFFIKKFHGNIVFFAYESIYHWKGNYIVLILVKILLKKISYFGCY